VAVDGDMGAEGLGVSGAALEALAGEVEVLVNSAATTTFDERFDVAVKINTLGAQRCAELARRCPRLEVLVHVSTAFVNGQREGYAAEAPFAYGVPIKAEVSTSGGRVDVEGEVARALALPGKVRARLAAAGARGEELESAVTDELRREGMRSARRRGWQDTYVYTKALGEMLLARAAERHGLPCCVVRPSIVESAYREPLPGWVEGIRMADPILLAYGKGQLRGFVADAGGILDVVPVDFVTNAILAAMPRHARSGRARPLEVYHVATSTANPLTIQRFVSASSRHFAEDPFRDRSGAAIRVDRLGVIPTPEAFQWYALTSFLLPAALAEWAQRLPGRGKMSPEDRKRVIVGKKTYEQMSYMCEIYSAYTSYRCRFGSENVAAMLAELSEADRRTFNFDLSDLDWDEYIAGVHIPGLRKFVLKGRQ